MEVDRSTEALVLTLPDGAERKVAPGTLPTEVIKSISEGLLRAAVAVEINGRIQDLVTPLRDGGSFRVLTAKDAPALDVLRHSAAHILATAVRRVRPDAKIGFGPSIEDGFYYDFEVDHPFTPEDLALFEAEMKKVAQEKLPFERREVNRGEAQKLFADDPLKLERLAELGDDEVISVYRDGNFIDLCRGPHVPDTSVVKHVKLLHTAGAYWRGDVKRQMLQRIYGTAWFKKDDLDAYLFRIEEAKRRDHRKLGRELDLFMFSPVSPGAAFWTQRGTTIYNALVDYVRERQRAHFEEVKTPLLYNKALWEQSGHWGKYKENMFLVLDNETGEHDMSLKPMNCPSHYLLYNMKRHSSRELPVRFSTQDVLHRNEASGVLSGLTRVRQFQQDDAHIICMEEQVTDETRRFVALLDQVYSSVGFEYVAKFSTRPEQRIGDDALWDRAEAMLKKALDSLGRPYELKPGEGAFYGPKIDFDVSDSIGRKWQLGTFQLDYNAPERFNLVYVGEDNQEHRPVVLHRAIYGSFERFIAILIEHFAGAFPFWLAPVQAVVLPISEKYVDYADAISAKLRSAGLRADVDRSNEKLGAKIRDAQLQKVPWMLVVGEKEAMSGTVSLRKRTGGDQGSVKLEELLAQAKELIHSRALTL